MDKVAPEVGPQCGSDDPFTRRMRLHQSWWRTEVLRVPYGQGPERNSPTKYGNMLTEEDGNRGLNFLTPEIGTFAMSRQREFARGIRRHRLLCNMLSSQPMCFNLFGPAALDGSIAIAFVTALFGGRQLRRIARVIVEHAPAPCSDYLDDGTSFDAFFEVEDARGDLGFLAVETKLTEPFSTDRYPIADGSAYRRWIDHERSPWPASCVACVEEVDVNQLFRDHALAVAARHRAGSPYAFAAIALVRHPADPSCAASVATYSKIVRPDADVPLIDLPLDEVVRRLQPVVASSPWEPWLEAFDRRYVDLTGSASLAS